MTLEELDRLEKAATKAPWETNYMHDVCSENGDHLAAMFTRGPMEENSTLIAAARNALPKLLAVAKAAKEVLQWAERNNFDGTVSLPSTTCATDALADLDAALAEMEAK